MDYPLDFNGLRWVTHVFQLLFPSWDPTIHAAKIRWLCDGWWWLCRPSAPSPRAPSHHHFVWVFLLTNGHDLWMVNTIFCMGVLYGIGFPTCIKNSHEMRRIPYFYTRSIWWSKNDNPPIINHAFLNPEPCCSTLTKCPSSRVASESPWQTLTDPIQITILDVST